MAVMAVESGGRHDGYSDFPKRTPLYWMDPSNPDDATFQLYRSKSASGIEVAKTLKS